MRYNNTTFILLLLLMTGCLGTRYLEKDELLLVNQDIKNAEEPLEEDELKELFIQTSNRQIPIIPFSPYVWFYQIGKKNYDVEEYKNEIEQVRKEYDRRIAAEENKRKKERLTSRKKRKILKLERKIEEGNVLMNWGEPLARYDSSSTALTKEKIELYMQSKGYFQGKVTVKEKQRGKKLSINYIINKGDPYLIDTTFYNISDKAIKKLVLKDQRRTLLRNGNNYDQEVLADERERLSNLLKNNGYYSFNKNYIDFDVDTAFKRSKRVAIRTTINNPVGNLGHQKYRLNEINFVVNPRQQATFTEEDMVDYKGIRFKGKDFSINPKVLQRRIFLSKDSLYDQRATLNTQRQLANLDNFKFINISYDTVDGKFIGNIYASPLSRYQWSNEFGVNVTQGFPGPFYNLSFKKRNIFGGLENFNITARIGIEGVAPATNVESGIYRSTEAGINAALTFPQFILPISNKAKEQLGRINPKTTLNGGYSYTNRPEYSRENTNISAVYSWEKGRNILYSFSAIDLSLINSSLDESFKERLTSLQRNSGNNLIFSFNPSFVSSMKFAVTMNKNNHGLGLYNSRFFRLFLESGGTTLNLLDSEFLQSRSEGGSDLEYYQFLKLAGDYRKNKPVREGSALAYRINVGFALPYSDNNILPYEKYFFAGGSNGIRAWRPRRLGPGSYTAVDTTGAQPLINYDFEQPGEILFEGSIEWRQNLIGFIDYAWFLDFGNIWTIREDPGRKGANFELDRFYKEIAVGSGLGIRFDFSFLILRLDAGVKLYDPARPPGKRFILTEGFYDPPFIPSAAETVVLNIGIGYPF